MDNDKLLNNIGEKIKALRNNLTLAELADRCQVDKSILCKIENNKMAGTLETHKRLAEAFGMKLSEFYNYLEEKDPEPAQVHAAQDKSDIYQDVLEILTRIPLAKKMLPVLVILKPKESAILEETLKKAERFILVLEGKIEIKIEEKTYRLAKEEKYEKGDSLYSASPKRHTIKNIGETPAKILCVSAPPVL